MSPIILCLIIILVTKWVHRWWSSKCNGALLPPGSMGLPLLGETLDFFAATTTSDIPPFVHKRMQKYGPVFKTSLVGQRVIVSTDSELNYFIFQQEGELFESWYPTSVNQILGRENASTKHGFLFKYLKNIVLNSFGPESLKTMLPELQHTSIRYLEMCSQQTMVDVKEVVSKMIFALAGKRLISYDSETSSEDMREHFEAFIRGLISFPLNIPGTAFHKCLQGRKKVMKILRSMLQERKEKPRQAQTDFFDYMLEELNRENTVLTEAIALDLIFVLLFAAYETTSLALTLAVKLLHDNPLALKQFTEEHEAIIERRENPDSGLTWTEYKSMKFTSQVINETVRLANIVPGIFRKSLKETKFKEYTIPAGWMIMVCPPAVHLNPDTYEDPLRFNPWRWEGTNNNIASKNFMVFGGGMRVCVGADFAKVQMAVFLHSLVTKYKWEWIKGGEILRTPGLQFPNGYHIRISQK